MNSMNAYQTVEKYYRRLSRLSHARSILGWDEAVMMPQGGSESRANSVSELVVMSAEIYRNPEFTQALRQAETQADLSPWQRANLREAQQAHSRMMAVDPALMEKQVQTAMACEQAWRKLRAANDWQGFQPKLAAVVELAREESRQRSAATGLPAYDAMVDLYEPGLRVSTIERVFNQLREKLPSLIDRVIERQKSHKLVDLGRPVPAAQQKQMMSEFMKWLGFDFDHGRLDESHHPFCGGVPRDIRMTTRYSESDFLPGLMGVLHETGHAMYEQNLPLEWLEQPVGNARGMAFHESQSLFVEMQVSRSREFVRFALPILKRHLAAAGDPDSFWTEDNIVRHITQVEKGLIRVDADEVTYPAHVILRFEVERGLIEGSLQVKDLPGIWDEKMKQYLGLSTLGNDKDGCMQDVHWPSGAFGYFPSYSLGALTAAQLMAALTKQIPDARARIAQGEIKHVMDWLRANVWSKGSSLSSEDLMKEVTGAPLGVDAFLSHVNKRYLES